jgi:serine/threonine protein kinase
VQQYVILEQIGEGKFGKVYKSCKNETFQKYRLNLKNLKVEDIMACKIIQL